MIETINFADPLVQAISVLLGLIVLIAGRRLFWFTVAAVGFVIGLTLVFSFVDTSPEWVTWLIALAAGLGGALLAVAIQKVAVSLAGFLMGGYVLVWLLPQLEINVSQWNWLIFIVGGLIGALLISWLFEYTLIGLSSLVGATMILQVTNFSPEITLLLFIVLLLVGIVVQAQTMNPQSGGRRSSW